MTGKLKCNNLETTHNGNESQSSSEIRKTLKDRHSFFRYNNIFIIAFFLMIGVALSSSTSIYDAISNPGAVFGIDVSHYQGKINWPQVKSSHHPIEFVFIRATMGVDGKDERFRENWEAAKDHEFIRGAYHYYRPNEHYLQQFENFFSRVTLEKGDFAPILDVEKHGKLGTVKLREGILKWLKLAEKTYGIKPVIYTGRTFYRDVLKGHVDDYPLWIASYSCKSKIAHLDWCFHQFSEKLRIKGIDANVDGNNFKRDLEDLKAMTLK